MKKKPRIGGHGEDVSYLQTPLPTLCKTENVLPVLFSLLTQFPLTWFPLILSKVATSDPLL